MTHCYRFLVSFLPLVIAACAVPIPASEMMPNPMVYNHLDDNSLTNNVAVGQVTISEDMPSTGFVVTEKEFKAVLDTALNKANWHSKKAKPIYALNADVLEFDQPITLFNTKIFSIVHYELISKADGNIVYQQTVKIPCVKGMGEYFDGNTRQIETMKCSIRENVTHVFRDLNSKF